MPNYFFDLYDGQKFHPDEEGVALPSVRRAHVEAMTFLAEMAKEQVLSGHYAMASLVVTGEDKSFLFKVTVSVSIDNEWAL